MPGKVNGNDWVFNLGCMAKMYHTTQYDLYMLEQFKNMQPYERIKEFDNEEIRYILSLVMERGKQYYVGEDYCIALTNTSLNDPYVNRVDCNRKIYLSVGELPYAKSQLFEDVDDEGIFYKDYMAKLLKYFKLLGDDEIESQIRQEEETYQRNCYY